ncbi:MAG: hypothetical protein KDA87_18625 [Planctomycetales bacterium]|nr:hypothetical protein [Planctomycetales bacterium]
MSVANQLLRDILRIVNHLNTQEYVVLALCAIVIGSICLRGFGSRAY